MNDAAFILKLLNQPSFIRYIGDKGVCNLDDARRYLREGPMASYERNGFGLYLVALKDGNTSIGICGLLKRPGLQEADLGFAFLEDFWSKGYAVESANAVLNYARKQLGLTRVLAITAPDNNASIKLLEKIGFKFERITKLSQQEPNIKLFSYESMPAYEQSNQETES